MAAESTATSVHNTLTGTTVDTITLTSSPDKVDVINRAAAGGADLYVTRGYTGASPTDPVAAADGTRVVPPGGFITYEGTVRSGASVIIKIIGNGNAYSVIGVR